MSTLLLVGIVMAGVPAILIIGFAAYIFLGFINDDKDARQIFNVVLIIMGIGILLVVGHYVGTMISVT